MKKIFYLMAMAIVAATFTACSDDDSEAILSIDPSVSEGIVAELDGGFYEIPVTTDQSWTARLEDGCIWASLSGAKGEGSGSIEVCVDANYTGIGRKTNVLITSGDKVVIVPVSQRTPDTNDDDDFYNIASNKGLGYGFDLSSFSNGSTMIFNLKAIQKLVEADDVEYEGLFTSDVLHDLKTHDINVDSVEEKADTLGVSLRMNINYGLFHLGVKAKYEGTEKRNTNSKLYKVVQSAPMLNSKINYNEILTHYRKWVASGKSDTLQGGEKDYRKNLLQNTPKSLLDSLYQAKDEGAMKQWAQAIYSTLGPAFISGTTLGGSVAMQLYIDSVYHEEAMKLDTAEVDVAFKSGLFSLDAKVDVEYKKKAKEILNHANCNVDIRGGSVTTSSALGSAFKAKQYEQLDSLYKNWVDSLILDNDKKKNTTSIIAVDVVPIWVLADVGPARQYLRKFVLEQLEATGNRQLIYKFDKYPY